MWLYLHDDFALHDTGPHPECPQRTERINAAFRSKGGIAERSRCPSEWSPATHQQCAALHDGEYLTALHERIVGMFPGGHEPVEADTVVSPHSWDVAMLAAGAAIDAVHRVLDSEDQRAFVVARPPGHHAVPRGAMGFCLVNNVALAAQAALERGLERICIVDFDVHHGNGTQDLFYRDPRVAFVSMHRFPFYPGTGDESETGAGDGLGTTANVPISFGTAAKTARESLLKAVESMVQRQQPELLLFSAGFDAHFADPVGALGFEEQDFAQLTDALLDVAEATCGGRVVSLLEGGYHLDHLPQCAVAHAEIILRRESTAGH